MKADSLSEEKRLMLLLSMINDNGKDKLIPSIEKVTKRICSLHETHSEVILNYLVSSIKFIPLKAEIYATILLTLRTELPQLVEKTVNSVCFSLREPQTSKTQFKNCVFFLVECFNVGLLSLEDLKQLYSALLEEDSNYSTLALDVLVDSIPFIVPV